MGNGGDGSLSDAKLERVRLKMGLIGTETGVGWLDASNSGESPSLCHLAVCCPSLAVGEHMPEAMVGAWLRLSQTMPG